VVLDHFEHPRPTKALQDLRVPVLAAELGFPKGKAHRLTDFVRELSQVISAGAHPEERLCVLGLASAHNMPIVAYFGPTCNGILLGSRAVLPPQEQDQGRGRDPILRIPQSGRRGIFESEETVESTAGHAQLSGALSVAAATAEDSRQAQRGETGQDES